MTSRRAVLGIVLAIGCLVAAIALQVLRDRAYPRDEAQARALMYVRSGPAMRRIALSFDALAADVYWIRAVQHYGGDRLDRTKQRKYELLYPLLDITTSLDPYFTIAYRFGAIFLAEAYPGGAGEPDLAIRLLEKGIAAQPTRWQYYHDAGFVHYWQLEDPRTAAAWFRKGAAQPGAPNWLEPLAATMLVQGGDRASARFVLNQIMQSDQEWLRRAATRSLKQIDAFDAMDALRQRVAAYPPPPPQPYSWEWLVSRGALRGIPLDPEGVPYEIDPASGDVRVSARSDLWPMPRRRAKAVPRPPADR
ncbi:MAG: hypothetical protein ACREUZ_03870 [Burkholderiales bacterium]